MPQIDLEPHEYRRWHKGKWVTDISPRLFRNMMVVCIAVLGCIWWYRSELGSGLLFGDTALFAWCTGIFFHGWLKDVY